MRNAGSTMARIWGGIKYGLGNIGQLNNVGPKSLNGGEVVISAGELFGIGDDVGVLLIDE